MSIAACALGVRQPKIDDGLRGFLRAAQPWALILFREACVTRGQVAALCADLRDALGCDAIVFIDQEGGRVARLRPPDWPLWPAAKAYGDLYARNADLGLEAAMLGHRLIAHELKALGIDGDFAPVCDTPIDGADPIIGDRAFSRDPDAIAALARAALAGLRAGGVVGCVKHMPGHGRAEADSHKALPRVAAGLNELGADFAPFRALADADIGMTAHIVFEALDREHPATQSRRVIHEVIRGALGFKGLLVSDDLDMHALSGPLRARTERSIAAGCDVVLQCSGVLAEMEEVASAAPPLAGESLARARSAEAVAKSAAGHFDAAAGWWRLRRLLGPSVRAPA
jgi:beta-N-acetylhexosaminidase